MSCYSEVKQQILGLALKVWAFHALNAVGEAPEGKAAGAGGPPQEPVSPEESASLLPRLEATAALRGSRRAVGGAAGRRAWSQGAAGAPPGQGRRRISQASSTPRAATLLAPSIGSSGAFCAAPSMRRACQAKALRPTCAVGAAWLPSGSRKWAAG